MPQIIFRKPRFRKNLFISKKPYFFEKSQQEGIKDLKILANRAYNEGAWIFSPQNSIWFNVTKDYSRTSSSNRRVNFSVSQHNIDLRQFGREVIHYHIHPYRAYSLSEHFLHENYKNKSMLFQDFIEESPYEGVAITLLEKIFHLPSSQDLETYLDLKMSNREVSIKAGIIAKTGCSNIDIVSPRKGQTYESWYERAQNAIKRYEVEEKRWGMKIRDYIKSLKEKEKRENIISFPNRRNPEKFPPTLDWLLFSVSGIMNITFTQNKRVSD